MLHGTTRVDLFPMVYDFDNLYAAYLDVARGKREHRDFVDFSRNIEENLISIQNNLIWKRYQAGPVVSFYVYEPKKRFITRPTLRDRIVHHALMRVVEDEFYRVYRRYSYACYKGRGTLKACQHVSRMERQAIARWGLHFGVVYVDIKSFFQSVDHSIVKQLILEVFADDPDIIWLFFKIIDAVNDGLPIGFLPSQFTANLYNTTLDILLQKLGVDLWCRYNDDILAFVPTRDEAFRILGEIDGYCRSRLNLELNTKKSSATAFRGKITYCGYVCAPHHLEVKRDTVRRAEKRLRKMAKGYIVGDVPLSKLQDSVRAFRAYCRHAVADERAMQIMREMKYYMPAGANGGYYGC